ncbi:DUF4113 domain-containing protein [Brucella tritici]|uniref:DUF4113 domain-containing protein n=1 Tax=Brucella tritici TaxID=94626 RepID=UPI0038B2ED69
MLLCLSPSPRLRRLVIDAQHLVSLRLGRNTFVPGAIGLQKAWATRLENRSPLYTMPFEDVPVAR